MPNLAARVDWGSADSGFSQRGRLKRDGERQVAEAEISRLSEKAYSASAMHCRRRLNATLLRTPANVRPQGQAQHLCNNQMHAGGQLDAQLTCNDAS